MIVRTLIADDLVCVYLAVLTSVVNRPLSVVGDFNGWDPLRSPFTRRDGFWLASVLLQPGRRYAFRYLAAGGVWLNDDGADAYESNEFGSSNSILDLRSVQPERSGPIEQYPLPRSSGSFRVFLSSTFRDMVEDRDVLHRRAFTTLRSYCQRRGAGFQVIDLRWGVHEAAADDQQTMAICFDELQRCQQLSPYLNFLAFVGDRYGWRPPPARVPAAEFEDLLEFATTESPQLVWSESQPRPGWYRRDDNAVPPEYVLRARRKDDAPDVETTIAALLRPLVARANWSGDDPRRFKYEDSATHQEIRRGILDVGGGKSHAFCYIRRTDRASATFAASDGDMAAPDATNDDERTRLTDLRSALRARFDACHLREYSASPDAARLDLEHADETIRGLDALSDAVERSLCHVLDGELFLRLLHHGDHHERGEARAHEEFAATRGAGVVGRDQLLTQIVNHVAAGAPTPLVLYGPTGAGKSALLARATKLILERSNGSADVMVTRFVGATPASADTYSLLGSICRQIASAYGDTRPIPADPLERRRDVCRRLQNASAERPLFVCLDALDQLGAASSNLDWLPQKLPRHVTMIISALESDDPAHACWRVALRRWPTAGLRVGRLDQPYADALLDAWLQAARRKLTSSQRSDVLQRFAVSGLPLFLRLAFEESRLWKSWEQPPADGPTDTAGVIQALLTRLEDPRAHGYTLTSRALGYLAAARAGLSEDELLDVLSLDDEAMAEQRRRAPQSPQTRRLPFVVWARLRGDLGAYLTERRADASVTTLGFYHRQMHDVVVQRYLPGPEASRLHAALAALFRSRADPAGDGTWAGRYARGLSELPYHLAAASDGVRLSQTLTDFSFLSEKISALGVHQLSRDFALPQSMRVKGDMAAVRMVGDAINLARYALAEDPAQLAGQLLARVDSTDRQLRELHEKARAWSGSPSLRPAHATLTPSGHAVVAVLSGHADDVCALAVTRDGRYLVSGSSDQTVLVWDTANWEVVRVLHIDAGVRAVVTTHDGTGVVIGTDAGLQHWSIETGEHLRTLGEKTSVHAVAVTRGGCAVAGLWRGGITIWSLSTGEQLNTLEGHTCQIEALALAPDERSVFSAAGRDEIWTESGTYVQAQDDTMRQWDLSTGREVCVLKHEGTNVLSVAVTPDGRRALTGCRNGRLTLWDLSAREPVWSATDGGELRALAVTPDGKRAVSATYAVDSGGASWTLDHFLTVWDLERGMPLAKFLGHTGRICAIALTPDGSCVVSGGGSVFFGSKVDTSVRVWDLDSAAALGVAVEHGERVNAVTFIPQERAAVSVADDGMLKVWDLDTGAEKRSWRAGDRLSGVAVSADGRWIVTVGSDFRASGKVWDRTSGALETVVAGSGNPFGSIVLTPREGSAVSASSGILTIWDLVSGKTLAQFSDRISVLHSRCLALTLDGRYVVCPQRTGAMAWDLARHQLRYQWSVLSGAARVVCVTPDGRRVLAGTTRLGIESGEDQQGYVYVWEFDNPKALRIIRAHSDGISALAVTPSGDLIVSASTDGTARVWHLESGAERAVFSGHSGSIEALSITPDAEHVITGSRDGTIQMWELESGRRVAGFSGEAPITDLELSFDGMSIVAGDSAGRVLILQVSGMRRES